MKLFLQEQRPLIMVYIAQLMLITLIYRLDGYRNLTVSLYAGIISLLLLLGYLAFRFIANRSFYKRLEQPLRENPSPANPRQNPLTLRSLKRFISC